MSDVYQVYLIVLILIEFILAGLSIIVVRKKPYFGKTLVRLLVVAITTTLAYIMFIISGKETTASWWDTVYFVCIDWLTVFVVSFVLDYCKDEVFRQRKWNFIPVLLVGLADSLMMIILQANGKLLDMSERHIFSGNVWSVKLFWPYYIHTAFCYFNMIIAVIIVLWRRSKEPGFYKNRYMAIVISLIAAVVVNALCYSLDFSIDLSIILYSFVALVVCISTMYIIPHKLRERTLNGVMEDMNSGICCFDINEKCVYVNVRLIEMMAYTGCEMTSDEITGELVRKWIENGSILEHKKCKELRRFEVDGDLYYLQITLSAVMDKGAIVGSFYEVVDQTEVILKQEAELYKATHDKLTGLYNREAFFEKASEELHNFPDRKYYMLCSDIKDFKLINDLFGNKMGDDVLKKQAELIHNASTHARLIASRINADKFAMLIPVDGFDEDDFVNKIKQMQLLTEGSIYKMHIHIGIYEIDDIEENIQSMCDKARLAIKSIKNNYSLHIAYYDSAIRESLVYEKYVVSEFEGALARGEFCMYLQPQVKADGKAVSAEALVRWIHPTDGMISPGKFIPVLEKAGLIHKLDMFMLETAAKKLAEWNAAGKVDKKISINISVNDFFYIDIYHKLVEMVEKYKIHPEQLNIEITETALMKNFAENIKVLEKIKEYGFLIEIDDFGSGYSSLNMLKDIKADVLKIDMLFLRETENKLRSRLILKSVIRMAKDLGMKIIVEGVETEEQLMFLEEMECGMYQGYYFSKPIPVNLFEEMYLNI